MDWKYHHLVLSHSKIINLFKRCQKNKVNLRWFSSSERKSKKKLKEKNDSMMKMLKYFLSYSITSYSEVRDLKKSSISSKLLPLVSGNAKIEKIMQSPHIAPKNPNVPCFVNPFYMIKTFKKSFKKIFIKNCFFSNFRWH